jgi:hypothetical protein
MANGRFKDFGGGQGVETSPISFKLYDEEFSCRPVIQGKVLLNLMANSSTEDAGSMAETIGSFFDLCLLPESLDRFNTLLENPDKIVTVEALGDITGWLVEQYSARPTQQPESSSNGQ